jgi:hypothetical protein
MRSGPLYKVLANDDMREYDTTRMRLVTRQFVETSLCKVGDVEYKYDQPDLVGIEAVYRSIRSVRSR